MSIKDWLRDRWAYMQNVLNLPSQVAELDRKCWDLKASVQEVEARAEAAEQYIKRVTATAADISRHDSSYLVLVGKYNNQDYVQVVEVPPGDFKQVLDLARERKKWAGHQRFDTGKDTVDAVRSYLS
jgi:hypothetical protein